MNLRFFSADFKFKGEACCNKFVSRMALILSYLSLCLWHPMTSKEGHCKMCALCVNMQEAALGREREGPWPDGNRVGSMLPAQGSKYKTYMACPVKKSAITQTGLEHLFQAWKIMVKLLAPPLAPQSGL